MRGMEQTQKLRIIGGKSMINGVVIEKLLSELIRQQKITNVYLKELTEQKIKGSYVISEHLINELEKKVKKQ